MTSSSLPLSRLTLSALLFALAAGCGAADPLATEATSEAEANVAANEKALGTPTVITMPECCSRAPDTYYGSYEFKYCSPSKIITVCQLKPDSSPYPFLRVGSWCQMASTHPLWPGKRIYCGTQL